MLSFLRARTITYYRNSRKSNTEKSDNFCYRKVGRAITKQREKGKVQYCDNNIEKLSI